MRALHLTPLLIVLATPAFGQDVSLQRCRALTDNTARLTCYDALADAARVPATPAKAATPAVAAKPAPAAPTAPQAATAIAAVAAPVTTPAPGGEAAFGLPEARKPGAVESVESTLGADFSGWGPNTRIKLANGQTWLVIDGTSVVLPPGARKVSVKRGMLGSYYLDIQGLNTSPRVRRVD